MTTENRIYPVRGQTYTLAEVAKLYLRDSPFLQINHNDRTENVQFSEDLGDICKGNAIIAESRWTYVRETDEWIPIFRFANDNDFPLESVVTIVPTRWTGIYSQGHHAYVRFIGDNTPELTEFEEGILARNLANLLPTEQMEELAKVNPNVIILDVPTGPWENTEFAKACGYGQAAEPTPAPAPVRVSFPIDEMLKDPLKAKAYVEDRSDNAKTILADLEWDCSNENDLDKAKLYFAGLVHRYKPNHTLRPVYWGMVELKEQFGKKQAPVYFKTEECFVAWVLARFW